MKQTWKKYTGFFLALVCMLSIFAVPAQAAALDEETKASLGEGFEYYIEMLNSSTREEMEALGSDMDSAFFDSMVEQFYDAIEEAGAFRQIVSTTVEELEGEDAALISTNVSFEKYDATISAHCFYKETNVSGFDDLFSSFHVEIDYPLGELMKQAALNTLMGICIVFLMLIFLSFVISLFKYVNVIGASKQEAPVPETKQAASAVMTAVKPEQENDDEIAVVLATAIAAYEAENRSNDPYVVRSIKKVNNKSWKRA